MQSPPLELVIDVAHRAALNLLRARGEADADTISEVTRAVVERIPHGPELLAVGLAGLSAGFWWHIVKPLRPQ